MLIHVLYQYTVYFNILITHTLTHSHTFTKTFSPSLRPTVFHPNVAVLLQCPTTVMVLCLSSITRVYCDKITEIIYDHADFTKKVTTILTFMLSLTAKFDWGPVDRGLKLLWVVFDFAML